MQIVFVHGVFVRDQEGSDAYERGVSTRRRHFKEWCLEGAEASFFDPYWGEFGAAPAQGWASIPRGAGVALGLGGAGGTVVVRPEQGDLSGDALLRAARSDFGAVLNTLSLTLAAEESDQARKLALDLGRYAAGLDSGAAEGLVTPAWVAEPSLRTDEAFLERLEEEAGGAEEGAVALGFRSRLKAAGRGILGAVVDIVDGPVEKLVRKFTPHIATFVGDVFVYLRDAEPRARIRERIAADIVLALRESRAKGQPLVLIGHSMGAIILFDLLTDPGAIAGIQRAAEGPLDVALLLTVGTQIGLFEELGLFSGDGRTTDNQPACVRRWWHVYNRMDVLSFGVEGVISGPQQFSVDTHANIVEAHGAYFESPLFHQRLRKRMIAAGLLR